MTVYFKVTLLLFDTSYPIQILKPKLLSDSFQIVDTCNFVLFASLSTLQ